MNYPDLKWRDDSDHVLFDIGYSWALLERTVQAIEAEVSQISDKLDLLEKLKDEIKSFQERRCRSKDEMIKAVYDHYK